MTDGAGLGEAADPVGVGVALTPSTDGDGLAEVGVRLEVTLGVAVGWGVGSA